VKQTPQRYYKTSTTPRQVFDEKWVPEPNTGCWLWMAYVNPAGYGRASRTGTRSMAPAHRVAWEIYRGPIPEGMVLDHICRERSCVNPDHLRVVTQRENLVAPGSLSPTARHAAKTHCPRCGGDYTSRDNGTRFCYPCFRKWQRNYDITRTIKRQNANREAANDKVL
jgi:hypothetical protein